MLKKLGVRQFFHKVSVQPGKPLLFGKKGKTYVFGLPGNPISTMVCFVEFIRTCLLKMTGCMLTSLPRGEATLDHEIKIKPKRTKFLRAKTRNGTLTRPGAIGSIRYNSRYGNKADLAHSSVGRYIGYAGLWRRCRIIGYQRTSAGDRIAGQHGRQQSGASPNAFFPGRRETRTQALRRAYPA